MAASNPAVVEVYGAAARGFADLVRTIPADRFDGPGLGEWDLRALVGHTSRSLVTVITYLDLPAAHVDISGPEEYYRRAAAVAAAEGAGVLDAAGERVPNSAMIRPPRSTRW